MESKFNTYFYIFRPSFVFMIFFKKALFFILLFFLACQVSCSSKEQQESTAKVYVKKTSNGYQLIRNGNPFFIKGSSGNSHFAELKAAGANTLRIYDTLHLQQKLDMADSLGLAVIVDIPVPRFVEPDTIFSNEESMAKLYKGTKKFVTRYKDHPALLYWILGNEINYPDLPGDRNLQKNFSALIDLVHELDMDHPVSTAIGGFDRSKLLSIKTTCSSLDLFSINIFGELSTFTKRKENISVLWDGPYVFSEFGINGPWEADKTTWGAPIEETSTKKAEQYKERYHNYIKTIDDGRCLGSVTFYWGQKQERTHTWFSTYTSTGGKMQTAFEMENLWKEVNRTYTGPELNYLLLNERGAKESIVLSSDEKATAQLLFLKNNVIKSYRTTWEIRPENWNYAHNENEKRPDKIDGLVLKADQTDLLFITPHKEGPYRLYVSIEGENGYFATANVPFYVLNPENGA